MKRTDVKELHYIAHIDNLKSILKYGILCHNKIRNIKFKSIADSTIQNRRAKVVIPGVKRRLHDYANLYFNARNPMMFKRRNMHKEMCILQISTKILDQPDVVISDGNASSDYVRFYSPQEGFKYLDKDLIFAEYWTDPNYIIAYHRKFAICAEVLVLNSVSPEFIIGIYVSCENTFQKLVKLLKEFLIVKKISINPNLFFQGV